MTQRAQIIDITRSYLPGDPNAFVHNLINTEREDGEEKSLPVLPYEGVNFLPTAYGYKSYFGTNSLLDIDPLASRAQWVFAYQLPNYQTRLIALCEDGIWVCNANVASSAWTQAVVFNLLTPSPSYDPAVYQEWTWCVIENVLYMYQQGRSSAWKTAIVTNELTIQTHTPNFLNMAGQMGIFKAGIRLGFWDSANSISWSSNLDLTDFTPAIENMAGNSIFGAIIGRIVTIKSHGEGFIIYATKSIVGATYSKEGSVLWDAKKVLDDTGISYSRAVTAGKTDNEHFVFSSSGIHTIGKYNTLAGKYETEVIIPEVYDFLRESRDPVYLSVLKERYLCLSLINADYIYGRQSFYTGVADPLTTVIDWYIPSEVDPVPVYELLPEQMWELILNEMLKYKKPRTDNRFWLPLFDATYDRIKPEFYCWYTSLMGEDTTGLLNYTTTHDPDLNIIGTLTGADISNIKPAIASSRIGTTRSFTDIRARGGDYGAGFYTNERIIAAQESEWAEYAEHAILNKETIEARSGVTVTNTGPIGGTAPANSDNTVDSVLGTFMSGSGNTDWLVTKGPADDAAREIIMRKIFNKAYRVTKRTRTQQVHTQIAGTVYSHRITADIGNFVVHKDGFNVWTPYNPGLSDFNTDFTVYSTVSAADAQAQAYAQLDVPISYDFWYNDGVHPLYLQNHYTWDSVRNINGWLVAYHWDGSVIGNSATSTSPSMFNITWMQYTNSYATYYTTQTTETITYIVEEINENVGYSQCRFVVTQWDLIEPGIYGNYDVIQSVPASAMTPKVWDNHFPDDRDARDTKWSYSSYYSVKPIDLRNNTVGGVQVAPYNPDADPVTLAKGITANIPGFSLPGATFLLQTGSIEASYPTFKGALVFDLHLKKWGKYKGDHKHLIEVAPINSANYGTITYDELGTEAGIFDASGKIYLFDTTPTESWMRWGKVGQYRLGMTDILEVKVTNRIPQNTSISIQSSMDGKIMDFSLNQDFWYWDEVICEVLPDIAARWHTVKISGNYDLTGLEVRSTMAGRR